IPRGFGRSTSRMRLTFAGRGLSTPTRSERMMETNSPGFTVKEMSSSTARWRPSASEKVREMPSSCTRGTVLTLIGSGPFFDIARTNGPFPQVRGEVEHEADGSCDRYGAEHQIGANSILLHAHINAPALLRADILSENGAHPAIGNTDA